MANTIKRSYYCQQKQTMLQKKLYSKTFCDMIHQKQDANDNNCAHTATKTAIATANVNWPNANNYFIHCNMLMNTLHIPSFCVTID